MTRIIRFYNKRFSRLQGSSDVRAVPIRQEEVESPSHAGAGNQRKARKRKAKQKISDLDVVALFL